MSGGKSLKILMVVESHSSRAGGGPVYWGQLSNWLMQRDHQVTILSGVEPGAAFASPNTIGLFPVRADLRRRNLTTLLSRLGFAVRLIPAVRAVARRWQPDIIHTVPPIASEAALRAGRAIKSPVILSILSHVETQWSVLESRAIRAALFRWIERYAIQRPFTRIICLTQHSRNVLQAEGIPAERLVFIPHAVDVMKFNPKASPTFRAQAKAGPESFVLGYAGALTKDKGISELLHALAQLQHRSELRLLLVGEGADRQYFERLTASLGLQNVRFLGAIEHDVMPSFMASLDLYLVPSYTETLPTTVIEALATGTPVMATSVGGVAEFLQDELGIVLSHPTAEIIAEAIDRWAERRAELKRMGEAGRQRVVKEHSWEQTSLRTEEVYQQCLQEQ